MKQTTKVLFLSTLIFPGIGHLLLKKYAIALAFIISFSYLLIGFINSVIEKVQWVVDRLIRGEIPIELSAIRRALEEQNILTDQQQELTLFFLLFIWFFAAFDAYRIAKKNQENSSNLTSNLN